MCKLRSSLVLLMLSGIARPGYPRGTTLLEFWRSMACLSVSISICAGGLETMKSDGNQQYPVLYQELLGSFPFLATRTRPDISAAVSILCRNSSNPHNEHWVALKRVLSYLQGTANYCLRVDGSSSEIFIVYCDADWGGNRAGRRSTSSVLLFISSTLVLWKTVKQSTVDISFTEAEN